MNRPNFEIIFKRNSNKTPNPKPTLFLFQFLKLFINAIKIQYRTMYHVQKN